MTKEDLIKLVQQDLMNERMHLAFYLQASVMVSTLHRNELREFLFEEAQGEFKHVEQFSELIVHLGGVPTMEVAEIPVVSSSPIEILEQIVKMEQTVADNYAERLRQTHEMENAATAYVHVFYEDQITDSQKTAWEVTKMIQNLE